MGLRQKIDPFIKLAFRAYLGIYLVMVIFVWCCHFEWFGPVFVIGGGSVLFLDGLRAITRPSLAEIDQRKVNTGMSQ